MGRNAIVKNKRNHDEKGRKNFLLLTLTMTILMMAKLIVKGEKVNM